MDLTKLQHSELICKYATKEKVIHDLMEIMIESMMVAERSEFPADKPGNKGNGYRSGSQEHFTPRELRRSRYLKSSTRYTVGITPRPA